MPIYKNEKTKEISFPLGGIGTGCIGLGGNGRLMDWEIFNRPNKGSLNGYSHLAVKACRGDKVLSAKVLNGDLCKDLIGQYSSGYGFGPASATMAGFPHFKSCEFDGEFPIAELQFEDPDFPGKTRLRAWNPFIPLDDRNSSIPAAFFEIEFCNQGTMPIEYSAAFSVTNPFDAGKNIKIIKQNYTMVHLCSEQENPEDVHFGDLCVATDCPDPNVQSYWYRGGWQDGIATFWREFSQTEHLIERDYAQSGKADTCTLAGTVRLGPGQKGSIRFILCWNIPNCYNYWSPYKDKNGSDIIWKNYYATIFKDSLDSSVYCLKNWKMLQEKTLSFKNALFSSTLDGFVMDAVSANLSVLKSPTILRLEDGSLYGWEGAGEKAGSCEGTCTHVWNYAYALPFLFPKLERSIRNLEAKYTISEQGKMNFRMALPAGRKAYPFRACVDGQMGTVIKTYREWKICGDDGWLRDHWKSIQSILEYAWSEQNPDAWDLNKDGVLEGRQHHTLDMELFGPSSWLEGFYLAALKAASEMASYLGYKEKSEEYRILFENGKKWTEQNLFNGKYYFQKIDIRDKSLADRFRASETYWNAETGELKYQIGDGCEIDQLCAQWHANLNGLGDIFDPTRRKTALRNLFSNNFKSSMRTHSNPWRLFSLNDESGAIMCDYPPEAAKPTIPIPYCEETMTGFEYQLAGLLISEGFVEEGIQVVKGVRSRFDGEKRNPWNEFECGSNYARSMASFALLPIFSGFEYDLPHRRIGFNPVIHPEIFRCFWSLDSGWGTVEITREKISLRILSGFLSLCQINLPFLSHVRTVSADGSCLNFTLKEHTICTDVITIKKSLEILI